MRALIPDAAAPCAAAFVSSTHDSRGVVGPLARAHQRATRPRARPSPATSCALARRRPMQSPAAGAAAGRFPRGLSSDCHGRAGPVDLVLSHDRRLGQGAAAARVRFARLRRPCRGRSIPALRPVSRRKNSDQRCHRTSGPGQIGRRETLRPGSESRSR
jgi:hypothetical protein